MKKIKLLLIIAILFIAKPVYAANYEIKELIPRNIKTTIVTNKFTYKNIMLKDNDIEFEYIKNLTNESIPLSISLCLFFKNKKNIGTINYCDYSINPNEKINYKITIDKSYLQKEKKSNDIKYISVFSDNSNCRTGGSEEYIGQTIKEIGIGKNNTLDSKTQLLIGILGVLGGVLFLLFLYKFLFTKTYQNFDGDDVRQGYRRVNEDLKKEREEELKNNPPQPKVIKQEKTIEVLEQEEEAAKEDKSATDLHNLYK